jgi:hypothetical protein
MSSLNTRFLWKMCINRPQSNNIFNIFLYRLRPKVVLLLLSTFPFSIYIRGLNDSCKLRIRGVNIYFIAVCTYILVLKNVDYSVLHMFAFVFSLYLSVNIAFITAKWNLQNYTPLKE